MRVAQLVDGTFWILEDAWGYRRLTYPRPRLFLVDGGAQTFESLGNFGWIAGDFHLE